MKSIVKILPKVILVLSIIALVAIFWPVWTEKDREIFPTTATRKSVARVAHSNPNASFWETAITPEPENFRQPTSIILPQTQISPTDLPQEISRLQKSGDFQALNSTLAAWFEADPAAASDWLAQQGNFDSYQPALTQIVGKIATDGDPTHALEWSALLTPGPQQEQSLFDIYSIAARKHYFTEAQLRTAPLPPERIDELLSGGAGD
ncbi:MAG: hypothetical protein HC845_08125 [Akkermansiaceae bacterium]|nr:hypothetical protein [Akkermansiaceae bacterium]